LVEKEDKLGGNLNNLNILYPIQEDASIFLNQIKSKVEKNKNIEILLQTKIKNIKGYIGNYDVSLTNSGTDVKEIKIGTIIVATGAQEYKPNDLFQYNGKDKNVITQLELEQRLQVKDKSWLGKIKRATFILCAGARQKEGITYCSNVCCGTSIKNIDILKEINPNLEIVVLYRDFQMAKKEFEEYYRNRRKDAIFSRYKLEQLPEVSKKSNSYEIKVFDTNLQDEIRFDTDLIVLATPMIPADNLKELAMMLKVPLDRTGFFLEAHVKLRPLDFATDGIFLCGCAQWPKNIQDSISQANGAAGRASRFLSVKEITTSGLVAEVDRNTCIGCGTCEEVCSYNAVELTETLKEFEDVSLVIKKSFINPNLCKGCGTCAVNCPIGAISVKHYDYGQINALIRALII
ncbi:MAG: CoB--CoM heterodisulfide reductase iron-sulfur subunit A family protein, partial [Candidatus Thorarchaeota archaeon]